ncbi:MAG TPA: hypothetical protein VGY96_05460 [Streptosporangiaceae bacterium]|nr:hypothetical protein [Streptosporangiaceae bacterium]
MDLGVPDSTPGGFSHAGAVALASFDAANQASASYDGMMPVNHNPVRPDYHQSRGSATAGNGSHSSGSQANAVSTAVSGKGRSALEIMKAEMRIIT